jgi:hypothetical protein
MLCLLSICVGDRLGTPVADFLVHSMALNKAISFLSQFSLTTVYIGLDEALAPNSSSLWSF